MISLNLARTMVMEALGMALFVYIGAGSECALGTDAVGVGLATGLGFVAIAYTIAHYTGAHLNTAVTSALMIS